MLAVLAVLAILYVSYWQTIEAYPTSGGSYTSRTKTSAPMPASSLRPP